MATPPRSKSIGLPLVIFLVLAIPTIVVGLWYENSISQQFTSQAKMHVQTLEALSAKAVALRMDSLVDLATNYANHPELKQLFEKGQWNKGADLIENFQENPDLYDFYIDRVFLLGSDGKINVAFPGVESSSIGTIDAGYTTWEPMLAAGKPAYVSNVVLRSVSPRINVIKIIVPVLQGNTMIGAVRMDIPVNEFSDFGKDVELTSNGFAYFVDRSGQIISHPKISSNGPIVSFASVPSVERALQGQAGTDILYNQLEGEERLSAYGQVPGYGWGVIAQEPVSQAFAARNAVLNGICFLIFITCFAELCIAAAIFYFRVKHNVRRRG